MFFIKEIKLCRKSYGSETGNRIIRVTMEESNEYNVDVNSVMSFVRENESMASFVEFDGIESLVQLNTREGVSLLNAISSVTDLPIRVSTSDIITTSGNISRFPMIDVEVRIGDAISNRDRHVMNSISDMFNANHVSLIFGVDGFKVDGDSSKEKVEDIAKFISMYNIDPNQSTIVFTGNGQEFNDLRDYDRLPKRIRVQRAEG